MSTKRKSGCERKAKPGGKLGSIVTLLIAVLAFSTGLPAQSAIPRGTILPLQLNTSLNSKKCRPGQVITARLMQDVPLPSGGKIRAGSKATGHVLDVNEATDRRGAQLSLQFDTLEISKRRVPITTNLRALASMMEVEQAQIPKTGPDRGTSEYSWVTEQIGGDVVYGRGGPVARGLQVVTPTANGVLARVSSKSGTKCGEDTGSNDRPQALWLFSADACGTYGFASSTIAHSGRTSPVGQIMLASKTGNFDVRSGSGMLLRVE